MTKKITDMIAEIGDGVHDDELNDLARAIRDRRKVRRDEETYQALAALEPGDRVRLSGQLRPKYLVGYEGTVVARRGKKVVVDLDVERVRRYRGKGLKIPATCVKKIGVAKVASGSDGPDALKAMLPLGSPPRGKGGRH